METMSESFSPTDTIPTYTVSTSSVLCQDAVQALQIIGQEESSTPCAIYSPFDENGNIIYGAKNIQVLSLLSLSDSTTQIYQITRNTDNEAGWTQTAVGAADTTSQIVTGISNNNLLCGFYTYSGEDGTTPGLQLTIYDATTNTWSAPTPVLVAGSGDNIGSFDFISTCLTSNRQLLVYGAQADGSLVIANRPDLTNTTFTASVYTLTSSAGATWTGGPLAVMAGGSSDWLALAVFNGEFQFFNGTIGQANGATLTGTAISAGLPQGVTPIQMLGGCWDPANGYIFLSLGSDGNIYAIAISGSQSAIVSANWPGATVNNVPQTITSANVQVTNAGSLNLYFIDSGQNLWTAHQSLSTPWVASNGLNVPNFTGWLPIARNVTRVAVSPAGERIPNLVTLDINAGLSAWAYDTRTKRWRVTPVLSAQDEFYTVYRFRNEFAVTDGNHMPVPNKNCTLSLGPQATTCDVILGGKTYCLEPGDVLPVTTDMWGRVTVSVNAAAPINGQAVSGVGSSMAPPNLVLTVGPAAPASASPAGPINMYLSGNGTLNPANANGGLKQFDEAGTTLMASGVASNLSSADTGLAAQAATAIVNVAKAGLKTGQGATSYQFSLTSSGQSQSSFRSISPHPRPGEYGTMLVGTEDDADSDGFFGDVWQAIASGAATIINGVIDAANAVVTLCVQIGDDIQTFANMVITGLEDAASAISGIFAAIGAAIEDIINWLSAIFDFTAMWNAAGEIQSILTAMLTPGTGTLATLLTNLETNLLAWISKDVGDLETTLKKWTGDTSYAGVSGWSSTGTPQAAQTPGVSSNNAQNNWLAEKINNSPPSLTTSTLSDTFVSGINSFLADISNLESDIDSLAKEFWSLLQKTFSSVEDLANTSVSVFVGIFEQIVATVAKIIETLIAAIFDLVQAALADFSAILNQPITGILASLWTWVGTEAGQNASDVPPLTLGSLVSLFFAVPSTIIYRIIYLVENGGSVPSGSYPGYTGLSSYLGNISAIGVQAPPASAGGKLEAGASVHNPAVGVEQLVASGPIIPANAKVSVSTDMTITFAVFSLDALLIRAASDWIGPGAPTWLSVASAIASAVKFSSVAVEMANNSESGDLGNVSLDIAMPIIDLGLLLGCTMVAVLAGGQTSLPSGASTTPPTWKTSVSNAVTAGTFIYGIYKAVVGIDQVCTQPNLPGSQIGYNLTSPLPMVTSVLKYRGFSETYSIVRPYILVLDLLFGVCADVCEGINMQTATAST